MSVNSLAPDVPCEALGYDIMLVKNGRVISRGGQSELIRIDWQRILDQISVASVEIFTSCVEACGELPLADHWNTRLFVTFGPEKTVVWSGPVSKVRYLKGRVIIEARDNLAWATKRRVRADMTQTNMDVCDIAAALWAAWITSIGPPSANDTLIYTGGVVESRETKASQNRKVWNVFAEMLDTGLDVTTFGSKVLFGLPQFTPLILDDTMVSGQVEVFKDGEDMATDVVADASNDIVGHYPPGPVQNSLNGYPLLEEVVTDSGLQDQASVDNAARARQQFSAMGIRRVRAEGGLILLPTSNIDPKKLIAGQLFNFTATETCYQATETLRLGKLDISVAGGRETATIDLQPLGSVPNSGTV